MLRSRRATDSGPDLMNCGRFPTTETTFTRASLRRGCEPGLRRRIRLEEAEEQSRDLVRSARGRIRPVRLDVGARPRQPVGAPLLTVGPQVRTPADPRAAQLLRHPVLNEPADGKTAVVGSRLGTEGGDRVAAVGAARRVDETEVRIAPEEDPDDRAEVRLQRLRVAREPAVLARDRLLQPDDLDLAPSRACGGKPTVERGPVAR